MHEIYNRQRTRDPKYSLASQLSERQAVAVELNLFTRWIERDVNYTFLHGHHVQSNRIQ